MTFRPIDESTPRAAANEAPIGLILAWFNLGEDGRRIYHTGEGYWDAETAAWWWANTAPADYFSSPIEESITGKVTHWAPMPQFQEET